MNNFLKKLAYWENKIKLANDSDYIGVTPSSEARQLFEYDYWNSSEFKPEDYWNEYGYKSPTEVIKGRVNKWIKIILGKFYIYKNAILKYFQDLIESINQRESFFKKLLGMEGQSESIKNNLKLCCSNLFKVMSNMESIVNSLLSGDDELKEKIVNFGQLRKDFQKIRDDFSKLFPDLGDVRDMDEDEKSKAGFFYKITVSAYDYLDDVLSFMAYTHSDIICLDTIYKKAKVADPIFIKWRRENHPTAKPPSPINW